MIILLLLPLSTTCLVYREPAGAYGRLEGSGGRPGEVDRLGDLDVYRFGPSSNTKWLIFGHDIYGVDSGRTKEVCATINEELGVTVILPDFFRGVDFTNWTGPPPPTWDTLETDWEDKLVPYLLDGGAEDVAVVGTCYGSYLGIHFSSTAWELMKGGIYFHPGHPGLMTMAGEDEAAIYATISSPQAFMDTPDSAASVRDGGLASDIIETTFFEEFESPCDHGFFNRGDLADPAVAECVQRGLTYLKDFVTQYVINT